MRDGDALEKNPEITRSALEAIHSQVFGWALSRCDYERTAAEDLMQQTYVELLSGRARFDGRSSLKTFVFAVLQNLARGRFKRHSRRLRLIEQHAEALVPAAPGRQDEDKPGLWRAVSALPARQRDIIELVFLRELTVEQASAVMGVTAGTGRVHYDRAKKALRAVLEREEARHD